MILISLQADKPSFKDIYFTTGINIILGKQHSKKSNSKHTYNGVGKSLIIEIIHFCLGADKNKQFQKKIPNWTFILTFEIDNITYISKRNTSRQDEIILDSDTYSRKNFNEKLLQLTFSKHQTDLPLTFRELIPRFIRRSPKNYNECLEQIDSETPYKKILANTFLLGLDPKYSVDKKLLITELTNVDKRKKDLKNDEIFQKYFKAKSQKDKDILKEIAELKEQIATLSQELSEFKVAKNYHEIEEEANKLALKIKQIENSKNILEKHISDINDSLSVETSISSEEIIELYESVKICLPEQLKKNVNEVHAFHQNLKNNRKLRLQEDLKKFEKLLGDNVNTLKINGEELDKNLLYLKTHGALEEFISLTNKLNDLTMQKNKLENYIALNKDYENKIAELKKAISDENAKTNKYLTSKASHLDQINSQFKNFCDNFYENADSELRITNNMGDNSIRFDINVNLTSHNSTGIKQIEIFCYDMVLLLLNLDKVNFIFHDNNILSHPDPRQYKTLFEIIHKITQTSEVQYIISMNQSTADKLAEYKDFDFTIIKDNIILELTDENEKGKLLGIQVDL